MYNNTIGSLSRAIHFWRTGRGNNKFGTSSVVDLFKGVIKDRKVAVRVDKDILYLLKFLIVLDMAIKSNLEILKIFTYYYST